MHSRYVWPKFTRHDSHIWDVALEQVKPSWRKFWHRCLRRKLEYSSLDPRLSIPCFVQYLSGTQSDRLEDKLARFRGLLEKEWANKTGKFEYVYPGSGSKTVLRLTPFLMHEWARAMVRSIFYQVLTVYSRVC